jgi:hypothetical protein
MAEYLGRWMKQGRPMDWQTKKAYKYLDSQMKQGRPMDWQTKKGLQIPGQPDETRLAGT